MLMIARAYMTNYDLCQGEIAMKTAILTDSNSGIFPEEGDRLGIFVLPMPIILDETEYFEGVTLTPRDFYQHMAEGCEVSTSQPSPGDVISMFDRIFSAGYDELVYIPMSSGLSFSYQTAQMLSKEYGGRVQIVDNHRISVTLYDSVLHAKALADQGIRAKGIQTALEAVAMDSIIYLGVNTLKYLKKNGRCTPTVAALGDVLSIKPLLICQGGRFDRCCLPRSTSACQKALLERAKDAAEALRTAGGKLNIGAASSFVYSEAEEDWEQQVREAFPWDHVHYEPLSFSVACHTGPNAFGVGISRQT